MGLSPRARQWLPSSRHGGGLDLVPAPMRGRPAWSKRFVLNHDRRNPDGPLYDNATGVGTYRLVFEVWRTFASQGRVPPQPFF